MFAEMFYQIISIYFFIQIVRFNLLKIQKLKYFYQK